MIEIKDLLARFDNILLSGEFQKDAVRRVISDYINTTISSEDIEIKNGTVYLNIKPIFKNEILIKRVKIDEALEKVLGKRSPREIR